MVDGRATARTVWLASYPKSGNTWVRAILTALATHPHLFAVSGLRSGSQPNHVNAALAQLGLDPRWLNRIELDRLRESLVTAAGANAAGGVLFRKTHEVYRSGPPGREPFPTAATRAAILVVRDPRDVACSYAPFFGLDLATAVDRIGSADSGSEASSPARAQTAQPWGSWSSHASSWLDPSVPFPVHLVRYEDLQVDAVATLLPVLNAVGLTVSAEELAAAVARTRFERLARSEEVDGFDETSPNTERFFRRGRAGGWHEELPPGLVAAVEADHGVMMEQLGYPCTGGPVQRARLAQARSSRRRAARYEWFWLPEQLGLEVTVGEVPTQLPGAARPKPWVQVTPEAVLARFADGSGVLVVGGKSITVAPATLGEPGPEGRSVDAGWLVQGWGVTLAMLQRGHLSLHAATVQLGAEVVALAGRRGAGKSTTSMALRQLGHQLLTDDVTVLQLRDGQVWTTPYSRNVHLLPDAAAALGLDHEALPRLSGRGTKVAFRPEEPEDRPRRLDRIVVLTPTPQITEVSCIQAHGSQRLSALSSHTRRDGIAPLVLGQQRYFELLTELARTVPVWVLRRPVTGWSLTEVLARLGS